MQQNNSSDEESPVNYHSKNLDHIERLKAKKKQQEEEQILKEQKRARLQESLKQKILSEAIQRREQKQQQIAETEDQNLKLYTQQVMKSSSANRKQSNTSEKQDRFGFKPKPPKIPKQQSQPYDVPKSANLPPNQELKEQKEQDSQSKVDNYYRSRYASFLNNLAESKKDKQKQEQLEKEKKDKQLSKIRQEMGLEKVQSKVLEPTKLYIQRTQEVLQKKQQQNNDPKCDEEEERQGSVLREASKKLVEKQKQYLQELKLRKQQEKEMEEKILQKKEKIKQDLKQQVLSSLNDGLQIKTSEDIIESYKKGKVLSDESSSLEFRSNEKSGQLKLVPVKESAKEDNENEDFEETVDDTPSKPKKLRSYPFITDLKAWKKKQRLDDSVKVFIIMGGYPDLKKQLLKRGWVENPDHRSPCFDLKFTLMAKDIDYGSLTDLQIVNHFEKNTHITTKVGICKNLRNLIWFNNVDIDSFYPRCFDCNDEGDFEDFLEDFKTTKAESILKLYMHFYKQKDAKQLEQLKQRATIALRVCRRKVKDINELIDEHNSSALKLVSDKEWEILSSDDLSVETLAKQKHEQWLRKIEKENPLKKKSKGSKAAKNVDDTDDQIEQIEEQGEMDPFTVEVKGVLKMFKQRFPQYYLNGWENIWIIKPASLSRGRGIKCYQNLVEILDHMGSKESQWVVQKYIERPIIVMKRKMDIRQWVVVCDWNPLQIWIYDECYVRFSAENYDNTDLQNQMMHLTNNSITKKSKNQQEIVGNMWFEDQFAEYLKEMDNGRDVFYEKIKPQMKQAVLWSLESVQDQVENRKNSFEMFGYDFMVDDKFGVWLIEVNSSPAMDYSTHVTEKLVKDGMSDLTKVIVDFNMASKSQRSGIDTGKFQCYYRGKNVVEKPNTLGLNLCIEGKTIKR